MNDLGSALDLAASGMRAQAARLRVTAENISNADTPGYRRKTLPFSVDRTNGGVEPGRVQLDRGPLPDVWDPSHPMADANGYYKGSTVDLIVEIADAREAQRSYEASLKMFEQTRKMSGAVMDILRR
ncbi:MAG TPA: flagellar basal body rod protein FlgC [Rhodobacteraceae bacterium]|nr:flagellar basal body rod protein FlgC [Paracoccaceae bacterium]HBG98547.1 flagellar basal body rod protein FlgC [Paracoccaceae bacterium]